MVFEHQFSVVRRGLHFDLFTWNMDFCFHLRRDFHFVDKELAIAEETCHCWYRFDHPDLLSGEFGC